jgi:hypothetical protein
MLEKTAYFIIPSTVKHGQELRCSHQECRSKGARFLFCGVCQVPAASKTFTTRHSHNKNAGQKRARITKKPREQFSDYSGNQTVSNRSAGSLQQNYQGESSSSFGTFQDPRHSTADNNLPGFHHSSTRQIAEMRSISENQRLPIYQDSRQFSDASASFPTSSTAAASSNNGPLFSLGLSGTFQQGSAQTNNVFAAQNFLLSQLEPSPLSLDHGQNAAQTTASQGQQYLPLNPQFNLNQALQMSNNQSHRPGLTPGELSGFGSLPQQASQQRQGSSHLSGGGGGNSSSSPQEPTIRSTMESLRRVQRSKWLRLLDSRPVPALDGSSTEDLNAWMMRVLETSDPRNILELSPESGSSNNKNPGNSDDDDSVDGVSGSSSSNRKKANAKEPYTAV